MTEEDILAEADRIRARRAFVEKIDKEFSFTCQIVSFDTGERERFDLDETAKGWLKAHLLSAFDLRYQSKNQTEKAKRHEG